MTTIQEVAGRYSAMCAKWHTKTANFLHTHATALFLVVGIALLGSGLVQLSHAQALGFGNANGVSEANFNDSLIRNAVGNLFSLIEGAFGALIMVVSGLGAIVAAAMGAYRAAVGMLVVAVGAFILRSLVSLFFGTNFVDKNAPGFGGNGF